MIRKTILTLACFLSLSANAFLFGQELLQHVPADAILLAGFHPSSLKSKMDINVLRQLEFCKVIMQEFAQELNSEESGVINDALNNPSQYGMDFNSDSYFFMQQSAEATYYSYLFKLTDAKTFADFFKSKLLNAERGLHLHSEDGMTLASSNGYTIAWNEKVAILSSINMERKYDFDPEDSDDWEITIEEEPIEETEEAIEEIEPMEESEESIEEDLIWEDFAQRQSKAIEQFAAYLFAIPTDSTILSKPSFTRQIRKENDISLWADYSVLDKMGGNDFNSWDPTMGAMMETYQNFSQDTYLSLGMNFNAGAMDVDYDIFMNDAWMKYLQAATDAKINRRFAKYIKGDNLLGYLSMNYNMRNILKEGKNLLLPVFEAIPYVGALAPEMIDILDIAIDEEALYDFFKGDLCLAFTGMREFEKVVTTYKYDDDFNQTEVEELRKQHYPEFVMMLSYGDEENLKKFFRLGEKMGALVKQGTHYSVPVPVPADVGMDLFLAHHKGILFFTNDNDLLQNRLGSGYRSRQSISRKHRQLMKANTQVIFWDIPKSLNSAAQLGLPFGDTGTEVVNVSKQSLESILMTTPQTTDASLSTKMSFRFANKQMNALEQFLNFVNEIYLMDNSGRSM